MCTNVNTGAPQGLILRPLFFLRYLTDELSSNTKLLVDDISLFSVVHNGDRSVAEVNNDLAKRNHWARQ